MGRFNIYAIAYGIDPKTKEPVSNLKVDSWDSCKPYVVGVEGAKYKGFLTVPEADVWLEKTVAELTEKTEKTVTSSVTTSAIAFIPPSMEYDEDFLAVCKILGVSAKKLCLYLQKSFVAQQGFLTAEMNGLPFD